MKHIVRQGNTFLLSTEHTALLLQVTKYGHIELLYYSAPVPIEMPVRWWHDAPCPMAVR